MCNVPNFRLHVTNKAILKQVYDTAHNGVTPDDNALRTALQHFAVVPEFHITNNLFDSKVSNLALQSVPNIEIPQDPPPVSGYKAIVYMFLEDAMDSYSALIPVNCNLCDQYVQVRGDVAITSGLLHIDAISSNQHCNSFALHPSLSNLRKFTMTVMPLLLQISE